jgi:hypothetical protein
MVMCKPGSVKAQDNVDAQVIQVSQRHYTVQYSEQNLTLFIASKK